MFSDDALVPISALQHLLFCERQCALIHIERVWVENKLTVEGHHLHMNAHDGQDETRDGVRVTHGMALRSLRLGLVGQADVVEFRISADDAVPQPFPIEYKRGKPKVHDADRVQLCAQALCLEEMLSVEIPCGSLYYGTIRRRKGVPFDETLRTLTERTVTRLHELFASGRTPRSVRERKCDQCSLLNICMPDALSLGRSARRYTERALAASIGAAVDADAK